LPESILREMLREDTGKTDRQESPLRFALVLFVENSGEIREFQRLST
jgi:hypothetical protein